MNSDAFLTTIVDRSIFLRTASDIARFSFVVQDSVSYLGLEVRENSRLSDYFAVSCGCWRSKRLENFVNTEEKCLQFFAPRRRLLYTLHLDLTKGRECSLKDDFPKLVHYRSCCKTPLIAKITFTSGFYDKNLASFLEDAFSVNVRKEKILEWIVKVPFRKVPLLSRIAIRTASKFIDCFYPEATESSLFNDFIKQFHIYAWMLQNEQPEILEFLLYHARLRGSISLDEEFKVEFLSDCIFSRNYLNIKPILNYISDSKPTDTDYNDYLSYLSLERPRLTKHVFQEAAKSKTEERICRMAQIVWIFIDIQSPHRLPGYRKAALEALRLIWSSIKDPCVTVGELGDVFGTTLREELMGSYNFYVEAIGESHEYVEARPLKHLCRTVLRRRFQENNLWIPDAISRMGLPKSLQAFLNLEKSFAV